MIATPSRVVGVGTSPKIAIPNIVAVTISKYCNGARVLAGALDIANPINRCARVAMTPTPIII